MKYVSIKRAGTVGEVREERDWNPGCLITDQ